VQVCMDNVASNQLVNRLLVEWLPHLYA
jgi:hypothetical protein